MDLTVQLCNELRPLKNQKEKFSLDILHKPKHPGDEKIYYVGALMICKTFSISDIM